MGPRATQEFRDFIGGHTAGDVAHFFDALFQRRPSSALRNENGAHQLFTFPHAHALVFTKERLDLNQLQAGCLLRDTRHPVVRPR